MKKEQKKKDVDGTGETIVTSVRITKEDWKRIRIRAIEEDKQLGDLIGQAIREYCEIPIGPTRGVRS